MRNELESSVGTRGSGYSVVAGVIADERKIRVLLVGADPSSVVFHCDPLQRSGCECYVADSCDDIRRLLQKTKVDVVLGLRGLRGLSAVMALLIDSQASMYCSVLVEQGCWWLPVVRNGSNCLGAPGLREREFLNVLARILKGNGF